MWWKCNQNFLNSRLFHSSTSLSWKVAHSPHIFLETVLFWVFHQSIQAAEISSMWVHFYAKLFAFSNRTQPGQNRFVTSIKYVLSMSFCISNIAPIFKRLFNFGCIFSRYPKVLVTISNCWTIYSWLNVCDFSKMKCHISKIKLKHGGSTSWFYNWGTPSLLHNG